MADAGDFLITSNYPTDKIVWVYEGDTTTDEYGAFDITISHILGVDIFCTGIWTTDDWETQYITTTSTHNGQTYSRYSQICSNDSEVRFSGFCSDKDGNPLEGATVKFRLWGFFDEATTQNIFTEETASVSNNNFIKDTRLGYPKLFMEGYADATQQTQTIYHNLGHIPFVEIWQNLGGKWYQVDYIDFSSDISTWTIHNTPSILSFNGDGYTQYKYYYRIYADE